MTLVPALADEVSVLTVTISLTNYPLVQMSQDIAALVLGGKTKSIGAEVKITDNVAVDKTAEKAVFLSTIKIKVEQNKTATYKLPDLGPQISF